MVRKIFTTSLAVLSLTINARAQGTSTATLPDSASATLTTTESAPQPPATPERATTFTASADVYYRYDLGKTVANNRTSFTNSHNSFELGMVSVKAEHKKGKVGMLADIGFGKRAEEFSYADDKTRFLIKQLNLSYTFKYDIKLTAGSWATHLGYEMVDAYANRNYSMSYMFSYGPFFHTGLKAEKAFGKTGIMFGVANPTDLKSTTFNRKFMIGQISTATPDDVFKAWLNYQGGQQNDSTRVNQFDLVMTVAVSPKFNIGANTTLSNVSTRQLAEDFGAPGHWWGAALYFNADPLDWLGLTLRTDYFNDADQINVFSAQPESGNIFAATFSLNIKSQGLIIIPEIRIEKSSADMFISSAGKPVSTGTSFLLAAVYKI